MVQAKHKKAKPKKQSQANKHGKQGHQGEISNFRAQLDLLDLKIIQVTSDGNCFFRALADQLEGNEEEHEKYRSMVVQYIEKHRELFEPFIEDDVPFDEYCQSMGKDGSWAGHMELQAASLVTHTNICIHRHMFPRWYIRNFDSRGARMIHLSYHDGEHYNSLRVKEDQCSGPAKPIVIKADDNLTASAQQAKSAGTLKTKPSKNAVYEGALKMVMAGSGCDDAEKVEQVLLQVDGDVDAATEFLIAEREAGETVEENDVCHENDKIDEDANTETVKHEENNGYVEIQEPSTKIEFVDCNKTSRKVDKKIPNNKVCPCGSKKKYKACCGAASGKTYSKAIVSDHEVHARRGKRGKQRKKIIPITKAGSCGSSNTLPDMGALCI